MDMHFSRTKLVLFGACCLLAVSAVWCTSGSRVTTHSFQSSKSATRGPSGASHRAEVNRFAEPARDYQKGEDYEAWTENKFIEAAKQNTSTFSVDVDNASYTIARRDLRRGRLPKPTSVRTEEFINFFDYDYREPAEDDAFSINLEAGPSQFGENKQLLHIGLKGRKLQLKDLKPVNLVFLIDVSSSMNSRNKLPLVKESLYTLVDRLRPSDKVGIVVYAGSSGTVLPPTPIENKRKIRRAISKLEPGGRTAGEAGIKNAYSLAERARIEGGINRVILATDGDFNVGRTGDALVDLIEEYRQKHISLTGLGFGRGNYKGAQMSKLTQKGNGNYFYIDSKQEARRIFGDEVTSTLGLLAADVKVQVEFDDEVVDAYRLLGYETRNLDNEDFADDQKDAAEVGFGHTVTALYEFSLQDGGEPEQSTGQIAEVRIRHKGGYGESSQLVKRQIETNDLAKSVDRTSDDFRFSAAVAEFAEILRDSRYTQGARFDDVHSLAETATEAADTKRNELLSLIAKARNLWRE